MPINSLVDKIRSYLSSILFPITIGVLALIMWGVPGDFIWIPAALCALLSFLPLSAQDGRAYIPLMIFIPITASESITAEDPPHHFYLLVAAILVSMIVFIIIKRPRFVRGDLMLALALLFATFLVSYVANSIEQNDLEPVGIIYIVALFVLLLFYILFSTILGRGETLPYFCKSYVCLACAIVIEVFIYQVRNQFGFIEADFSLGWAGDVRSASTILSLSLPFSALLVNKKKPVYVIPTLFVIYTIIILSSDSSLLCLTLAIVPLVLLCFRSYGKYYPYLSLGAIVIVFVALGSLIAFDETFNERYFNAILSLNFTDNPVRSELYQESIDFFLENPVLGTSISSMVNADGTITFFSDTVLSIMVMSGSLGLICFLYFEIRNYYCCLKKDSSDKYLFLVFLIMFDIIGIIDNTMFNLIIFLMFLIASSSYQMSNRADEVIVHAEYYKRLERNS